MSNEITFYTSMATALGSMFAILGFILRTKFSDQLNHYISLKDHLSKDFGNIYGQVKNRIKYHKEFRDVLSDEIAETKKAFEENKQSRKQTRYISWSSSGSGQTVLVNKEYLDQIKKELEDLNHNEPLFKELAGDYKSDDIAQLISNLRNLPPSIDDIPRTFYKGFSDSIEASLKGIDRYIEALLPTKYIVLVIILGVLGIFGVIWPLSFIIPLKSMVLHQAIMYGLLILGVICVTLFFVLQIFELRKLGKKRWDNYGWKY